MEPRDNKILRHIGLYRITLRPVLERLYFAGRSSGNVLQRLRDDGYIAGAKLPGRVSYYRLSCKGVQHLQLPLSRATAFGAQALQTHLGILWFCCMGETRRFRTEGESLSKLFPGNAPKGEHCVEQGDRQRLYQVYVPGPDTPVRRIVRELRKRFHEARLDASVERWMDGRLYAFATLVDTDKRRKALRAALKSAPEGDQPLISHAYFRVEVVPGIRTIKDAFGNGPVKIGKSVAEGDPEKT